MWPYYEQGFGDGKEAQALPPAFTVYRKGQSNNRFLMFLRYTEWLSLAGELFQNRQALLSRLHGGDSRNMIFQRAELYHHYCM